MKRQTDTVIAPDLLVYCLKDSNFSLRSAQLPQELVLPGKRAAGRTRGGAASSWGARACIPAAPITSPHSPRGKKRNQFFSYMTSNTGSNDLAQ